METAPYNNRLNIKYLLMGCDHHIAKYVGVM